MPGPKLLDPYGDNILINTLGPIRSREEIARLLIDLPELPSDWSGVPIHTRLHFLMRIRDLYIPRLESLRVQETIDLMIRQNYRHSNPTLPDTWNKVGGSCNPSKRPRAPAYGAAGKGVSGTGKTETILRCFACYPDQVITHDSFPNIVGEFQQMAWLSVDVPPSGRSIDLATSLMIEWDKAMPGDRFKDVWTKGRRSSMSLLDEWRQVAVSHFLGILHLDEIQNLFQISTLEERRRRKSKMRSPPLLSIVEDQTLKWILTLMNTWQIPLFVSGTPDGIDALTRRLSNTQRIVTSGYHSFKPFESETDPEFLRLLDTLVTRGQLVVHRLENSTELKSTVFKLTGGIPRLIIALWIAAHRVAFERRSDDLRIADFTKAAATHLEPVAAAVSALASADPDRMALYEDLLPGNEAFWAQFWNSMSRD